MRRELDRQLAARGGGGGAVPQTLAPTRQCVSAARLLPARGVPLPPVLLVLSNNRLALEGAPCGSRASGVFAVCLFCVCLPLPQQALCFRYYLCVGLQSHSKHPLPNTHEAPRHPSTPAPAHHHPRLGLGRTPCSAAGASAGAAAWLGR
jgi:hypothetical protein